jgi:hypothetical protein
VYSTLALAGASAYAIVADRRRVVALKRRAVARQMDANKTEDT